MRYAPEELAAEFAPRFQLVEHSLEMHRTPAGGSQQFVYCRFGRL
jgi:hypothetical protein